MGIMAFFDRFKKIFTTKQEDEQPSTSLEKTPPVKTDSVDVTPDAAQAYHKNMGKSRQNIMSAFSQLMSNFHQIDETYFEELEDALIMADVGLATVLDLTKELRAYVKLENITEPQQLNSVIVEQLYKIYLDNVHHTSFDINYSQSADPTVILFIGVNGAGKTTSIGKLCYLLKSEGKKVLLAAGDTFRAGAVDQLARWAERIGVDIVVGKEGSDPSGVIFDAVKKAKTDKYDVLLCDTAGRLQNKVNLMKELEKLYRVIKKEIPSAPHETFLVIDATTGQNGMSQAKAFTEVAPLSGVVLSKLDGSAKGGIVLAIAKELQIPVKFIGLGEQQTDLYPFVLENYLYGLFADLFDQ